MWSSGSSWEERVVTQQGFVDQCRQLRGAAEISLTLAMRQLGALSMVSPAGGRRGRK